MGRLLCATDDVLHMARFRRARILARLTALFVVRSRPLTAEVTPRRYSVYIISNTPSTISNVGHIFWKACCHVV
jgi:hypothetical protein